MAREIISLIAENYSTITDDIKNSNIENWEKSIQKNIDRIKHSYDKLLDFQRSYSNKQESIRNFITEYYTEQQQQSLLTKQGNLRRYTLDKIRAEEIVNFNEKLVRQLNAKITTVYNETKYAETYDSLTNDLNYDTTELYIKLETIREVLTKQKITYRLFITSTEKKEKKLLEKDLSLQELIESGFLKLEGSSSGYNMRISIQKEEFKKLSPLEGNLILYNKVKRALSKYKNEGNKGEVFINLEIEHKNKN